jgi:mRNA interferase RelE/StbE
MYSLAIHPDAEREWARLDAAIKTRFKSKLAKERLHQPRVAKDALHGLPNCYKIKITSPQFRLAYHVDDSRQVATLLAVSSRDDVYALLERYGRRQGSGES